MAKLPEKRRGHEELAHLQMRNAMQMRPPASMYQRKLAQPIVLGLCYFLSLFGLGLLVGPLVYFTKPLSRHHGAFMALLSFLILLVTAMVYRDEIAYRFLDPE